MACPAIVNVAVLAALVEERAATDNVTVPGPAPDVPAVIFTQVTGLVAVHTHPPVALTLICCVLALIGTVSDAGKTERLPDW